MSVLVIVMLVFCVGGGTIWAFKAPEPSPRYSAGLFAATVVSWVIGCVAAMLRSIADMQDDLTRSETSPAYNETFGVPAQESVTWWVHLPNAVFNLPFYVSALLGSIFVIVLVRAWMKKRASSAEVRTRHHASSSF